MRSRSLRARLTRAFALVVVLVLACAGLGLVAVTRTQNSVEKEVTLVQPMQLANLELRTAMIELSRGLRGYLLTGDERFLEAYDRGRHDLPDALSRLHGYARAEDRGYVRRQEELSDRWSALYPDVRALGRGTAVDTGQLLRGKELLDEFLAVNDTLAHELAQEQERLEQATLDLRAAMVLVLASVAVLAGGIAVLTGLRTSRAVVVPLLQLRDTLARLTAGDVGARAAVDPRAPAEVGAVAVSVNALAEEGQRLRGVDAERARTGELARELGVRIREHLVVETVLAEAVEAVGRALDADWAHVRLLRDGSLGEVARQWHAPHVAPLLPSPRGPGTSELTWLHRLSAAGRAFVVDDTAAEPAFDAPGGPAALTGGGVRACVLGPLAAGTDLYGLLTVARAQVHLWSAAEAALVDAVARDLGRALQHGHLFEQQRLLVEQLRELDRTKSDFLSTVSHELRTPLTSISGYVELLRDEDAGPVTAQQQGMLDVIERNTGRLHVLIEDLLTLSGIEAKAFRITTVPLRVRDLVESAAATVRPTMAQAGLSFGVAPAPDEAQVSGDPGQLERALLNLLSNAAKFSPAGRRVELSADVEGDEVVLTVADTGIGIPEKEQEQLFARFFRGSNAIAGAIQGTGLGLTIVRSIVEHHNGTLAVRSREGSGTTVEIRLPLLQPTSTQEGMPSRDQELEATVRSSGTLT